MASFNLSEECKAYWKAEEGRALKIREAYAVYEATEKDLKEALLYMRTPGPQRILDPERNCEPPPSKMPPPSDPPAAPPATKATAEPPQPPAPPVETAAKSPARVDTATAAKLAQETKKAAVDYSRWDNIGDEEAEKEEVADEAEAEAEAVDESEAAAVDVLRDLESRAHANRDLENAISEANKRLELIEQKTLELNVLMKEDAPMEDMVSLNMEIETLIAETDKDANLDLHKPDNRREQEEGTEESKSS